MSRNGEVMDNAYERAGADEAKLDTLRGRGGQTWIEAKIMMSLWKEAHSPGSIRVQASK
jgi:hypothetical protein